LSRFKRKFEIFEFLSNKNPVTENIKTLKGITINNQENPVKLRLLLSPGCGHCYTAYQRGKELIKIHLETNALEIIFNVNSQNTEDPFIPIIESMNEIFLSINNTILNALEDWHIKKMSLEDCLKKWKQTEISETTK